MKIKKEYPIESEGTLGCERLKTDKLSPGKVIYIPIVTFSDNIWQIRRIALFFNFFHCR